MKAIPVPSREERLRLAEGIIELSSQGLSKPILSKKENQHYIALQVGSAPYCNAVSLSWRKDRVSFYVPSRDLLDKAKSANYKIEQAGPRGPLSNQKYYFNELKLDDLQSNEPLFRAIIRGSMDHILSQRPRGK